MVGRQEVVRVGVGVVDVLFAGVVARQVGR